MPDDAVEKALRTADQIRTQPTDQGAVLGRLMALRTAGKKLRHLTDALPPDISPEQATALWPQVQAGRAKRDERYNQNLQYMGKHDLRDTNRLRVALDQKRKDAARSEARFDRRSHLLHTIDQILGSPAAQNWSDPDRIEFRRFGAPLNALYSDGSEEAADRRHDMNEFAKQATKRALISKLEARGWEQRFASPHGSHYLRRGPHEIRVSDHELPTAEDRPWSMKAQERSDRWQQQGRPQRLDLVVNHHGDWPDLLKSIDEHEEENKGQYAEGGPVDDDLAQTHPHKMTPEQLKRWHAHCQTTRTR